MTMSAADLERLHVAVGKLERQSFAVELANKAGLPIEALMAHLPMKAQNLIGQAVQKTMKQCLEVALKGVQKGSSQTEPRGRTHVILTAVTGAAGGFFGLPGMLVELPVTTTMMLHSIAEIAQSEGEDLGQPEAALACLEVLALGSSAGRKESVESAYYATRTALTQATREAATFLTEKGISRSGAPALLQFLAKVGSRFGIEVTEKAAAQLVPIAGALGGAAVNVMFTHHFQRLAQGHFAVRRMERLYGTEVVAQEYTRLRGALPAR